MRMEIAGLKPGAYINWGVGARGTRVTQEHRPFVASLETRGKQGDQECLCYGFLVVLLVFAGMVCGCGRTVPQEPGTVRFLIESGPANLDPRFAVDGQSQRIVGLMFSGLVERDEQMNLRGDLAESWESPDPLTYVFHLRPGVKFHDGRVLTSKDVK